MNDMRTIRRRAAMAIPAVVIVAVGALHWCGALRRSETQAAMPRRNADSSAKSNRPAWQTDWPGDAPQRNLFLTRLENFPRDVGTLQQPMRGADPADEAKSSDIPADQNHDQSQSALQDEVNQLHLQSTMMHPLPRALIDGKIVGEGAFVGRFRVVRIELSRIVVEKQGYQFQITLK